MTDAPQTPALRFGWTILHVPEVEAAVGFYERAFGLRRRFVDPSGDYGEVDTGETVLAFASHALVARNATHGDAGGGARGFEIALTTDAASIEAAFARALAAGCKQIRPPTRMPWGQTVGFVHDLNGVVVEICTPTGG